MALFFTPIRTAPSFFRTLLTAISGDERGNVAVIAALMLPVLVGVTGLGVEGSYWYLTQRKMQNASDSAVITAATVGGSDYDATTLAKADAEAKAVAAIYGFKHGVNGVSVVTSNNEPCPAGTTSTRCYSVRITGHVPVFMSGVIGYTGTDSGPTVGDATSTRRQAIRSASIALPEASPRKYCVVSLGENGVSFTSNGAPQAALNGCGLMSNGSATCNGGNLGADYGDAAGTNKGCGAVARSNVPALVDPYAQRWENSTDASLKSQNCSAGYPKVPSKKNDPIPAELKQWPRDIPSAFLTPYSVCGDLLLTGDVTIHTPPQGAVIVIWNGNLEFGPYTLKTDSTSGGLTIIFAGDSPGVPNGTGKLDFAAPTSELSLWKGIALYQVKKSTSSEGVTIGAAGNDPAWRVTGLVYLPNSKITFSGVVNKASNGESCFVLVVKEMTINGTGAIIDHGGCDKAGLDMPTGSGIVRGRLAA